MTNLDKNRNNFSVLCCNIQGDYNLSSIVRNSNAFLAKKVILYGKKRFDRRGAVGTYKYTHFDHVCEKDYDGLKEVLKDCHVVGIDNIQNSVSIENYQWPNKHIVMCFGEEGSGLPEEILSLCHDIVYITQYGSVRSLNVACASSIAFYDYMRKQ